MKTVVLGATPNTYRYAYLATHRLTEAGFEVVPLGIRSGQIAGIEIVDLRDRPQIPDVHTVTIYVGERNMEPWEEYILKMGPKRIIFNPGAENDRLKQAADSKGIETLEACTLVILSSRTF